MMADLDNGKRVLDLKRDSGKLELDEKGYTKFIPSNEELGRINSYISEELERAIEDHEPLWAEAADNVRTYKATKITIDGGDSILPAPIARIPADQIIARTFNQVMRHRPVFSFDPYFKGEYPVAVPTETVDPTGMPMMAPVAVPTDAETISRGLENGVEFKIRERIDFPDIALKTIRAAVVGAPYYIKICADPKYKTFQEPKVNGAFIDLNDKSERTVAKGDVVQWYLVSYFNAVKPVDEDDVDESPWFGERDPESALAFRTKAMTGEYFLVADEDVDKLATMTSEAFSPFAQEIKATTEKKAPQKPKLAIDKWIISFRWPVRYKDESGETVVKELDFIAPYHRLGKKALAIHVNPYDDKSRGYVLVDQMDDGDSTVGILKFFQTVSTHILQAEIKNAFHANNFSYWYDPDSEHAAQFEGSKRMSIGINVKGKYDEDWGVARVGAEHYSMLPLLQFCMGMGQQASNVSSYEQGDSIPGRTPAQTVAQILEQGAAQPVLFLRRLNRAYTKAMRLYLERMRQFQPMGETLPMLDEEGKSIIEIPFRFPVGEVLDNFRISLTAADEAAAKEHEFEQQAMRLNLFQQFASFVAGIAGPISNPNATPAQLGFFQQTIEAAQKIFDRIIGQDRTDEESFDLASASRAIVEERQMAMQMAMQPQIGAMNAHGQVPDAQGTVPGAAGSPDMGGPDAMGGQSSIPPDSAAYPAEGGEGQGGGF